MDAKLVLVVEDDPDHRKICGTILRHYGYAVLEAGDGAEAVRLAGEHRPDVVLMDARLPILDGWSATRELKQDPSTRQIPVIMLTAQPPTHARTRAREVGSDRYLTKPLEPSRMVDEVRDVIGDAGER